MSHCRIGKLNSGKNFSFAKIKITHLSFSETMLGESANLSIIFAITLSKWCGQPCVNQIGSFEEYNLNQNKKDR